MANGKTRHACDMTGSLSLQISNAEDIQSHNMTLDATQMAAIWIARRYHLPMPGARIIAALANFGGVAS